MAIRPLHNSFLFAFLQQQTAEGNFMETTKSGLLLPGYGNRQREAHAAFDRSLKEGRWALVLATGPKCKEVQEGDYVCLEPNMWTNSVEHDGIKIRKSDETKVMLISKERPDTSMI